MSRLYFHTPSGTAELLGSERAHLGGMCTDITLGVLDLRNNSDRLVDLVNDREFPRPGQYDYAGWSRWRSSLEVSMSVGFREPLVWRGHAISSFSLALNTACVAGSDAVKLAARLHGQCELHAWVDGPNRAWLADVMQHGRDAGVFRDDAGWEEVITLLRSRDDEPAVTSYSVCSSFPNRTIAGWEPPPMPDEWAPDWAADDKGSDEWGEMTADAREEYYYETACDQWGELPDDVRWAQGMAGLRASRDGLELRPDNWQAFRFRHNLSVFDLLAADRDVRLAAVFETSEVSA